MPVAAGRAAAGSGGKLGPDFAVLLALSCLLLLAVLYSITLGRYDIGVGCLARSYWDNIVPNPAPSWTPVQADVVDIRLPRILAALLIGCGLAVSGAALQGLFRNPLVDPGIIGVTSGAGFGGTLAILLVGGAMSSARPPPSPSASAASWWSSFSPA